ncbi:DUF2891 domain-containing protein [Cyclobacteriaceae bacterium]|jgi:hypothetical protein|nr:DUF2891 domain-containing protein [Cyclobacteriaceae bacterium]MDC1517297.1 DUF2891 domain-containing protein [Cyclobacteriaceae bacterium]|tara:strand:+ start:2544 stop:3650 length:1107 start_codon:yes stop_codon:yes gene_type:complete
MSRFIIALLILINACNQTSTPTEDLKKIAYPSLTIVQAHALASLPLACLETQYPNKLNQTLSDPSQIKQPKALHPAFYGCFDWHSSVHGHWSLVYLLKNFPALEEAEMIKKLLIDHLSAENIIIEVNYFNEAGNQSFERTYGWAWILKLAEELHTWDTPLARQLEANLQPLTDHIVNAYLNFLPKLIYPIRVGEHSNTAYGLSLAYDYAQVFDHEPLNQLIKSSVNRFYAEDQGCPLTWEPSGFDFLSPCLEEANLMRKVYSPNVFKNWLSTFLPSILRSNFKLAPALVGDRTDGKLVHLDGLNFSRAWCLYGIAETLPEYAHLAIIANDHFNSSINNVVDDHYAGAHWLGTFAIYALDASDSKQRLK